MAVEKYLEGFQILELLTFPEPKNLLSIPCKVQVF